MTSDDDEFERKFAPRTLPEQVARGARRRDRRRPPQVRRAADRTRTGAVLRRQPRADPRSHPHPRTPTPGRFQPAARRLCTAAVAEVGRRPVRRPHGAVAARGAHHGDGAGGELHRDAGAALCRTERRWSRPAIRGCARLTTRADRTVARGSGNELSVEQLTDLANQTVWATIWKAPLDIRPGRSAAKPPI